MDFGGISPVIPIADAVSVLLVTLTRAGDKVAAGAKA
jgi:hypothetical protein